MAGIYIHIPYCKQKCHYCNFYSFASGQYRDRFVDSLLSELTYRKDYLHQEPVDTIYFGGGTPSLLRIEEINRIVQSIYDVLIVSQQVEITLEANPDDLNKEYLLGLKQHTAVNRLSIGVQSFFSDDLLYLNRVHDGKQARSSIELALNSGFTRLTIDLIYGIPTLTLQKWKQNLETFFAFQLPHLSAYALTVEPRTALSTLISKGKMQGIDDKATVSHFQLLLEKTKHKGYVHYEISNFALPGHYSKHNSIYWMGGHYLGLGPSAHSFNGSSRQWNVSNMKQYVESDKLENRVMEKEILTVDQQYNEYVMTSLRTSWGCDTEHIQNSFGERYVNYLSRSIQAFVDEQKVRKDGHIYFLTDSGKLFADGIAASLFI